ncbi:MAG: hypothetical protein ACI9K9_001838, partial [Neolewinella sp.]
LYKVFNNLKFVGFIKKGKSSIGFIFYIFVTD